MFFLLFLSFFSFSSVRLAFFKGYDHQGQLYRLTEKGSFFHVAIEVEGQWYHAFPQQGSGTLDSLFISPRLRVDTILENPNLFLSKEDIKPYLGLPFDYSYTWSRKKSTYCSKFIAQILDIKPSPMNFESKRWENAANIKKGELGISPDDIYEAVIWRGFTLYKGKRAQVSKGLTCSALL